VASREGLEPVHPHRSSYGQLHYNPWLEARTATIAAGRTRGEDLHNMATTRKKYRTGITTEQIVDAAVELTRRRGLYGWTIRDLVATIGTSPPLSTTALAAGTLCRRVVSYVLAQIEYQLPENDDLDRGQADWREWFRATFFPMRPVLIQYPGVAKWILMHGRPHSESFERFNAEIGQLHRAGSEKTRPSSTPSF
jgi:hypothetical protein